MYRYMYLYICTCMNTHVDAKICMNMCIYVYMYMIKLERDQTIRDTAQENVCIGSHDTMLVPLRLHLKYAFD
jgi:hypothetical protein